MIEVTALESNANWLWFNKTGRSSKRGGPHLPMLTSKIQKQLSQCRNIYDAKAATDLTQGQMTLNATQQAYAKILGKSIFDFI